MPIESASSSATGAKLLACIDRPWKLQGAQPHGNQTTTWRRLDDDLSGSLMEFVRLSTISPQRLLSYIHRIYPLFCWQETHSMRSHHHGPHGRHGRVRLFAIAKTFRMHWPLHCRRPGKRKTILIDIVSHTDAFVQIWSAMWVCPKIGSLQNLSNRFKKCISTESTILRCRPSRAFSQPPHPLTIP